ncbi:hypothetical protein D3272_23490 [Lichenibacterium ramalinae]|uniref:Uncharacterized protein n=2 Tax=Lichenibacterium ramalinae TaxID=2316527 RepID=A0A4Q2R901_9HYPH|nr:hypothetical protein D3272_23490 [Lichenibacterium ramalinae]
MAIKYVDIEPGEAAKTKARPAPKAPGAEPAGKAAEAPPEGDREPLPALPLAKPTPKPRGRKKPLT